MAKLILLDRDGVINFESPDYIKSPDEWRAIPGSLEAIALLKRAGRAVGVCTNQAGVGRGIFTLRDLDAIHAKMCRALAAHRVRLDVLQVCPHHPDDACACRKPRSGMLQAAMCSLEFDPEDTCFVGDSARDLDAAGAAGCRAVLVRTGNGNATAATLPSGRSIEIFPDLRAFAEAEVGHAA